MANKQMHEERNSSIELLRIITIVGVIILHYNNTKIGGAFSVVKDYTANFYYLYFTQNMFICAVNLFVMISAFFLSSTQHRKLSKVIELLIQVIIFKLAFYFISILSGDEFSWSGILQCLIPANYFVVLYSVLYIISPYLNILLKNLSRKTLKKFMLIIMFIFSVETYLVDLYENVYGVTINGISAAGMYGSQSGYSIVNFVLIYFIGAYIRITKVELSKKKLVCGICISFIIMYISSILEHQFALEKTTTWNYNNPIIIIMAALILILFSSFKFNNLIINRLAKGVFTCFLFHEPFLYHLHIKDIVNMNIFILILHQLCIALGLFIFSYIVYEFYNILSKPLVKLINSLTNKISLSVDN